MNGLVRVFLLLCIAEQAVVGGNASTALVMHRHGSFGLHMHLVATSDLARGAGQSAGYGHTPGAPQTISSEDVTVISVLAGLFACCSSESPDTDHAKVRAECQRGFDASGVAMFATGATTITRVPIDPNWPGDHRHLLGVLRSSHAILI